MSLLHGYRCGVELGVSGGRFTSFLCATIHNMHMLAVDLWAAQPACDVPGHESYGDWNHEESYKTFVENCRIFFPSRVDILRMKTTDAASLVEDESVDFVFIDADHTYEGCTADIKAWFPKVRRAGMICGHDFNWPTVAHAVKDAKLGKVGLCPDNVWVHLKK